MKQNILIILAACLFSGTLISVATVRALEEEHERKLTVHELNLLSCDSTLRVQLRYRQDTLRYLMVEDLTYHPKEEGRHFYIMYVPEFLGYHQDSENTMSRQRISELPKVTALSSANGGLVAFYNENKELVHLDPNNFSCTDLDEVKRKVDQLFMFNEKIAIIPIK